MVGSVADPHHIDADQDPACHFDPDPSFYFDADQDPSFQIKALNLERLISIYILACHLQLYAVRIRIQLIALRRIRILILPFNLMLIRADPDPQRCTGGRLGW